MSKSTPLSLSRVDCHRRSGTSALDDIFVLNVWQSDFGNESGVLERRMTWEARPWFLAEIWQGLTRNADVAPKLAPQVETTLPQVGYRI
jgi:hypothetical protein